MKDKLKIKKLNKILYYIITVMLIAAMIFVISSYVINFVKDSSYIDIGDIEADTINMKELFKIIRFEAKNDINLLIHIGIIIIIAIPVIGLVYSIGYFIYRRNLNLLLLSTGVLFIIILSLIIGFIIK